MPSVSDFFTTITSAVTAFVSTLVQAINGITPVFWTESTNGGSFTFMGILILITAGVGLVYFAYRAVTKLVHRV